MTRIWGFYLESSVGTDQPNKAFDDEAKEESEPWIWQEVKITSKQGKFSPSDIEVSLGTEETHVHLHLGVQVAHAHLNSLAIFNLKLSFFVKKLM